MLNLRIGLRGLSQRFSSRQLHSRVQHARSACSSLLVTTRSLAARPSTGEEGLKYVSLPISEREFCEEISSQAILAWYREAKLETTALAAKLKCPDDPTTEELLRELEWLLEDASGLSWPIFSVTGDRASEPVKLRVPWEELRSLWHRRLHDRVPLQYLTHAAHWRDVVLAVGPGILIPRPETQCLIDFAVEAAQEDPSLQEGVWADLGTGSGALATGIASVFPALDKVVAVDMSEAACRWAAFNAQRLKLDSIVEVRRGSWWRPLLDFKGRLTGVLTNPPYIEPHVMPTLQAEVGRHEPSEALDGGGILGMDCLEDICTHAGDFLNPGGFLGIETGGPRQTKAVSELLDGSFHNVKRRKDMYGVERFVTANRNA